MGYTMVKPSLLKNNSDTTQTINRGIISLRSISRKVNMIAQLEFEDNTAWPFYHSTADMFLC